MSPQQSDKHSPPIDDALQDERHQSSAGTRHDGAPQDDPEDAPVSLPAEISRFLGQAAFPGDAARLRAVARMNQASEEVRGRLLQLPDGRVYDTVGEVLADLGLHDEIEWGSP